MKRWDLIVIGTGLAGLTAARTAVEMGAKVLVIGRGMGSLTLFGNTIDVLGQIPPEPLIVRLLGADDLEVQRPQPRQLRDDRLGQR